MVSNWPLVGLAVNGNGGRITAHDGGRDGMPATARIVIPANAVLVFTR